MICFQISIFDPLETAKKFNHFSDSMLWFAFKLVSLIHWKQLRYVSSFKVYVVICFQISIFDPLETAVVYSNICDKLLWFAFKLVSLIHWKQPFPLKYELKRVVICFQISIFDPLETADNTDINVSIMLWFAFKLVSLIHWKQREPEKLRHQPVVICFQISIFDPLETAQIKVLY